MTVRAWALSVAFLLIFGGPICGQEQRQQEELAHFWTEAEEKEYQACLPHSVEVWKSQRAGEDSCLVEEEHRRWLRNHPQLIGKKEIKGVMQECLKQNTAKINGTWQQFRIAFDGCMAKAYGKSAKSNR
jgi:hypothetical protein